MITLILECTLRKTSKTKAEYYCLKNIPSGEKTRRPLNLINNGAEEM